MAALFGLTTAAINQHLKNIYEEGELKEEATIKKNLMVRLEGNRNVSRTVLTYNLDAILSVGYRISSKRATQFRQWASRVLKQYMLKGYAINHSVVATQKYEDLKQAVSLLENVFNKELLLSSTGLRRMLQRSFLPEQIIHNNHLLDATTIHVIF